MYQYFLIFISQFIVFCEIYFIQSILSTYIFVFKFVGGGEFCCLRESCLNTCWRGLKTDWKRSMFQLLIGISISHHLLLFSLELHQVLFPTISADASHRLNSSHLSQYSFLRSQSSFCRTFL